MFGDCFAAWPLTAATSRKTITAVVFIFLSLSSSACTEDGWGSRYKERHVMRYVGHDIQIFDRKAILGAHMPYMYNIIIIGAILI